MNKNIRLKSRKYYPWNIKNLLLKSIGIDHHLEKVKQDAEIFSSGSDDMSSDDTDFNPDALEALSAKVIYNFTQI